MRARTWRERMRGRRGAHNQDRFVLEHAQTPHRRTFHKISPKRLKCYVQEFAGMFADQERLPGYGSLWPGLSTGISH